MKKLLLGALLFILSTPMFSQTETFVRKYTSYVSESKGVMQPWVHTGVTVVFNTNNTTDVVFYYPNGTKRTVHQVGEVRENKTKAGEQYQIITVVDDEDGTEMALQLFDDGTTLRILIAEGYFVEFHND
jgi:hypothetical protein